MLGFTLRAEFVLYVKCKNNRDTENHLSVYVMLNNNRNEELEQMVLISIIEENNDDTGPGSDLIPPAHQPNCDVLNMESDEAVFFFF